MAINRRLFLASGIALATALSVRGAVAQNAELKPGLSMPTLNTPFFTVLVNAASAEATSLGGSVVQTTNANHDASQQVTDFRNLINAGANAILAGVVDRAAIGPALDYAKSRNAPVVIVDDQPATGEAYAVVRADNLTMGERAAEALAAALTAKTGTVLQIQGALTTTNGRDRSEGFNAKFKDLAPDIKIIEQAANWDGPMSANVVSTVSVEDWHSVIAVNQTGVFYGMRVFIPQMLGRGGSVVNVSSIWGAGVAPYTASKGAVTQMSKNGALTYAKEKVRVNSVHPGLIATPMIAAQDPHISANVVRATPMGRIGEPGEVAAVILFLASDEASYVTGAQFMVDGGYTAQ